MKTKTKVYVVFKEGDNDLQLGLNVYKNFDDAKKMWEDRTGKPYEKNKDRENGCYLLETCIDV